MSSEDFGLFSINKDSRLITVKYRDKSPGLEWSLVLLKTELTSLTGKEWTIKTQY
jgi:hypothetical protein